MARGIVDHEGLNSDEIKALRANEPAADLPFNINKIGHVVLVVSEL